MKVLFLCHANSCRSQMAEGFARALKGLVLEPYSAGIAKTGLDPHAVRVMAEAGVDISGQRSKNIADLPGLNFDYVITLCREAQQGCPVFPGQAKVMHRGFDDPRILAQTEGSEEEILSIYRRVRDEIRGFVEGMPENLDDAASGFILNL